MIEIEFHALTCIFLIIVVTMRLLRRFLQRFGNFSKFCKVCKYKLDLLAGHQLIPSNSLIAIESSAIEWHLLISKQSYYQYEFNQIWSIVSKPWLDFSLTNTVWQLCSIDSCLHKIGQFDSFLQQCIRLKSKHKCPFRCELEPRRKLLLFCSQGLKIKLPISNRPFFMHSLLP